MSPLYQKVNDDVKSAMKAGDAFLVATLRFLISEIKKLEIDKYPPSKPGELTEEDVVGVLRRSVKQHKESIEMFEKGNRPDLVEKEKKELSILNSYLPSQMDEAEVRKIVEKAVSELGVKDFGKIMGMVMAQVKGKADGGVVSRIVKEALLK